jgi:hypothetical protein
MDDSGSKLSDVIPTIGLVGRLRASFAAFERLHPATSDFEVVRNSEEGEISMGLTIRVGQLES